MLRGGDVKDKRVPLRAKWVGYRGYLLDAKTQIVDAVRLVSFAIGPCYLPYKLGQAIVEFSCCAGQDVLFDPHGLGCREG